MLLLQQLCTILFLLKVSLSNYSMKQENLPAAMIAFFSGDLKKFFFSFLLRLLIGAHVSGRFAFIHLFS